MVGFCERGNEILEFHTRQQISRPVQRLLVLQGHDSISNRKNLSKSIIRCVILQSEELLAFC
jgi:hypothetical protein